MVFSMKFPLCVTIERLQLWKISTWNAFLQKKKRLWMTYTDMVLGGDLLE